MRCTVLTLSTLSHNFRYATWLTTKWTSAHNSLMLHLAPHLRCSQCADVLPCTPLVVQAWSRGFHQQAWQRYPKYGMVQTDNYAADLCWPQCGTLNPGQDIVPSNEVRLTLARVRAYMHICHPHQLCDIAIAVQWSCNFWHDVEHCKGLPLTDILLVLNVVNARGQVALLPWMWSALLCLLHVCHHFNHRQRRIRNTITTTCRHNMPGTSKHQPQVGNQLRTLPCLHKWSICPFSAVAQWHEAGSLTGQDYWWRPGLLFWQPIAQSSVRCLKCP